MSESSIVICLKLCVPESPIGLKLCVPASPIGLKLCVPESPTACRVPESPTIGLELCVPESPTAYRVPESPIGLKLCVPESPIVRVPESPTAYRVPESPTAYRVPESPSGLKLCVPESPSGLKLCVPASPIGLKLCVPESPSGLKLCVRAPGKRRRLRSLTCPAIETLMTLPWDIFAYIYGFITPTDVLALTLCCRDLMDLRELHFRTNHHRIYNLTRKLYLHELHIMKKSAHIRALYRSSSSSHTI